MVSRTVLFLCLISFSSYAQEFNKKDLLKATLTISPGNMLDNRTNNIYLHGHLEYFTQDNISIRGDIYGYLGSNLASTLINQNSSILFGGLYHLTQGQLDTYIGFQPGINITEIGYQLTGGDVIIGSGIKAVPVLSLSSGVNYFVGRYFNIYVSMVYIKGTFMQDIPIPVKLDELRLSFGLGFNIHTRKRNKQ